MCVGSGRIGGEGCALGGVVVTLVVFSQTQKENSTRFLKLLVQQRSKASLRAHTDRSICIGLEKEYLHWLKQRRDLVIPLNCSLERGQVNLTGNGMSLR